MRKLVMWNIITLDGYFEGDKAWDLSFHDAIWGPELQQFSAQLLGFADYIVLGRVTYEGMAAYWKTAKGETAQRMNDLPKLVFSRTLKPEDLLAFGWNNSALVPGNASDEISKLKTQGNGDMVVLGSANLSETFINDNQFDEFRIAISPVILGSGRPLFRNKGILPKKLSLVTSQQLSTGGTILNYKPD